MKTQFIKHIFEIMIAKYTNVKLDFQNLKWLTNFGGTIETYSTQEYFYKHFLKLIFNLYLQNFRFQIPLENIKEISFMMYDIFFVL